MNLKIISIVGARPQFIKALPVSKALRRAGHKELILHTGQHYDYEMSQIFFDELDIPAPDVNLGIGSGPHGQQTGQMLMGTEKILMEEKPDWVLVYGDTNSTLAGALAAAKLHIPIAHVEAGLRSFNREMPEEHNRVLTDHCADLLFCPTETAMDNLTREGIGRNAHWVGDTMYDATLLFSDLADKSSSILDRLALEAKGYLLVTVHRPYNTDIEENLRQIIGALIEIEQPIIFPIHPRTRNMIGEMGDGFAHKLETNKIKLIDPVGYLDMLILEKNSRLILTDSGGMQKEAFFFGIPCVTLRPETEWVETVQLGWNKVVGANKIQIVAAAGTDDWPTGMPLEIFGDGNSGERIVRLIS
jgi:UDP-GlcNAc3NAcA epimerase